MEIKISQGKLDFIRRSFLRPFGFKGGYITEQWEVHSKLQTETENVCSLGTQSVLWSDPSVFFSNSEAGGNALMLSLTQYALSLLKGKAFVSPISLLDEIFPLVFDYGKKITGKKDLKKTFVLNALVSIDNAAWVLYCQHNNLKTFDEMIPQGSRPALSYRHKKVAALPAISYKDEQKEIKELIAQGFFFPKIKIGNLSASSGDNKKGREAVESMLAWDKARLSEIYALFKDQTTEHTDNGKIPYYLDINGCYDSKETLERLLEHCDSIGMLSQILLIEEPWPESMKIEVNDLPVRIAADESAHSLEEVKERIELGYKAIALKPVAKTMSETFKIVTYAHQKSIPCFCADLTVPPLLVEWNKNIATRLHPLKGMQVGLLETNGHQNYIDWEKMHKNLPFSSKPWSKIKQGLFLLDEDYYACSGGIFLKMDFGK